MPKITNKTEFLTIAQPLAEHLQPTAQKYNAQLFINTLNKVIEVHPEHNPDHPYYYWIGILTDKTVLLLDDAAILETEPILYADPQFLDKLTAQVEYTLTPTNPPKPNNLIQKLAKYRK